jgi:hypothetical protein
MAKEAWLKEYGLIKRALETGLKKNLIGIRVTLNT